MWYTLQTRAKRESSTRRALLLIVERERLTEQIRRIEAPTRTEISYRNGKPRSNDKPLFPGYLFLEMDMDEQLQRIVRAVPGSLDFVSVPDTDGRMQPAPIPDAEAARFLQPAETVIRYGIRPGDRVTVTEGPFIDLTLPVIHTNPNSGEITAAALIFGRETPVTLHASQVRKAT